MGEPIRLHKGTEEITVNGRSEADALVAQGWYVGPRAADVEPASALAPAMDAAPEAAPKPTPKRAGEYGSGPGTTTNKVDEAKKVEVAKEQAQDKRDGVK